MLRFHNTLTGRVEEFHPMNEGEVRFYYCGPTVWDYGHIGNFRSAVAADVLRRYLKFKGFKVTHVMNITDVEDRIIAKSHGGLYGAVRDNAPRCVDGTTPLQLLASTWSDSNTVPSAPKMTRSTLLLAEAADTLSVWPAFIPNT